MTNFETIFKEHAVHDSLANLTQALADAREKELSSDGLQCIARLMEVARYIKSLLHHANPSLVPVTRLDGLNNPISKANSNVNQFLGDGNEGHLATASNSIDGALTVAPQVALLEVDQVFGDRATADQAIEFKDLAASIIGEMRKRADEVYDVTHEVKTLNEQLAEKIDGQQAQVDQVVSKINSQLDQIQSNAEARVAKLETAFQNSEAQRQKESQAQRESEAEQFVSIKEELDSASKQILSALEKSLADAERIVQLVGNRGLTGNYQRIANDERKAANLLQFLSLLLFSVMAYFVITTLSSTAVDDWHWEFGLFRLLSALALAVPASYAAHESAKHRRAEHRNRKIELELASIDAYLDTLDEDTKKQIKSRAAESYFGKPLPEDEDVPSIPATSLFDLLKQAILKNK
jgi:hypothetical protein